MRLGCGISLEDATYELRGAFMRLPEPLREAAGGAYIRLPQAIRFGPGYARKADFIATSERWSADRLRDYQWSKLKAILEYAARRVPWYGRTWAEWGVTPATVQRPEDLERLPLATKSDLRAHLEEFVSLDARPRDRLPTLTTGSLGYPTRLYYTRGLTRPHERAFIRDLWGRAGYRDGMRLASLRATHVPGHQDGRLWVREPTWNRWLYSSVDMGPESCRRILEHMAIVNPEFVHAMVSPLTTLAAFVVSSGLPAPPALRGVFVSMETSRPWQIALWRRAFGPDLRVIRWYGMGEHVVLAGCCLESPDYHVYSQYSYPEFLPERNGAAGHDGVCRVIGTAFDNWVMPLIRYDTGDYAVPKSGRCACGRPYQVLEDVIGRSNGWAQTRDGDWVPFAQIESGACGEVMRWALRFQFAQEAPGELHLLLVPAPGARPEDLLAIVHDFEQRLGPLFSLTWEDVPSIEPLPGGKHGYFVQKLALPSWLEPTKGDATVG
jgi:phenylacetate-CoA ligase